MNKKTIPIRGMHCASCELIIEEQLKEVPGVQQIAVNRRRNEASIIYRGHINMARVEKAIKEAGYSIGTTEALPWFTRDKKLYDEIALAAGGLFVLYLLLKGTGILNASFNPGNNPTSLLVVLMVGLLAGVSTCMALVGGLVLGLTAKHAQQHPEATTLQKFRPHVFFNAGRVAGYFVLGGLIGLIGQAFQLSGTLLGMLTIGVGAVMLLLGVQLTQLSPRLSSFGISLPASVSRRLGVRKQHEKEYSHRNAAVVGALTFFLPCGFTQAMQLYAMSTGSFWSGGMIMGVFALGTMPGLLGIGGLTAVLKGAVAQRFFKVAGLAVMGLALFNISNGLNLTGLPVVISAAAQSAGEAAEIQPGTNAQETVQIVRMEQSGGGYKPNKFTVKVGVPVRWIINSTNPNSCASSIYSQQLGVRRNLKRGENIIEFTPKEIGQIRFSCSMGMYTGVFNVVKDTSQGELGVAQEEGNPTGDQPAVARGAGCGGNGGGCGGCGGGAVKTKPTAGETVNKDEVQVIQSIYTRVADLSPNEFTVKAKQPVRYEIEAKDNGSGCMGSITIPGLTDEVQTFRQGKKIAFEFTPTQTGSYPITCAMGVPRGTIVVN